MNWTKVATGLAMTACIWTVVFMMPKIAAIGCGLIFTIAVIDTLND